jgi:hypothetical protein
MLDRTMWIYIYVIANDTHSSRQLRAQIIVRYSSTHSGYSYPRVSIINFLYWNSKTAATTKAPIICILFLTYYGHRSFFFYWHYNPLWVCILQPSSSAIACSLVRLLDPTQRRTRVGRTPLDEWSIRRGHRYY